MENKLINQVTKLLKNKLVRFFLVSGLNTAFGYGLFALFLYLGITYPYALFMSTLAGILFNFKTIGNIVFKNNNNILIYRFFGVYGVMYICNLCGLLFFNSININNYLGGAILVIPIGLSGFFLNKTFVFKDINLNKNT